MNCRKPGMNCGIRLIGWAGFHCRFSKFDVQSAPLVRAFIGIVVTLIFTVQATGQPQYLFTRFGLRDGLTSDKIIAIQQDKKGFIWIATNNSLQRYDGQRFISFFHQPGNARSIPDGTIGLMQMDNKGRLWLLASNAQIGYFSTDDFTYHEVGVKYPRDSIAKTLSRYFTDNDGNIILVPAAFGVFRYDEKEGVFTKDNTPWKVPEGWKPGSIYQDRSGNYWIGCEQGLAKYNPAKKTLSYAGHNADNDPVIESFSDITSTIYSFKDSKGRFWMSCWPPSRGFMIFSHDSVTNTRKEWQTHLGSLIQHKYYEISSFMELRDKSFWITGYGLLVRLNEERGVFELIPKFLPDEFSIRYDNVPDMHEDREGNAWVGTDRGLFRFNPSAQIFRRVSLRRPNNDTVFTSHVMTVTELPNGQVLAGTWGDGFFQYDKDLRPIRINAYHQNLTGEGMPWCIIQHSNGDVWRGNQGGVLYVTRAGSSVSQRIVDPAFGGSTIRQVAEDRQGNLWWGTQRGEIIKYDIETKTYSVQQRLKSIIAKLYVDSRNELWALTFNTGVFRINTIDGSILSHMNSKGPEGQRLRMDGAFSILQYSDSIYLIGGKGLAIYNINTNNISFFQTGMSFLLSSVNNIVKDKQNNIWLTSENNLARVDLERNILMQFNEEDGLPSDLFGTGAATVLKDGRILFGHSTTLVVFDPTTFTNSEHAPPNVEITGFALMNQWLRMDSLAKLPMLELRHDENSINLQFSSLSYLDRYAIFYMMENLDDKWISAGTTGEASYNYLPPGRYVFKVKSINGEGKESPITALSISISAPFWQTWWFYSFLLLGVAALLFWFDRERMVRKEAMLKMRTDIAGNLHEEVNVALNNINILSEMARIKADVDPQKSKEFIEQIHSKSHNMIISMDDMLWSIDPANDSMEKKVERIREYLDALRNRHDININIVVDKNVYGLKLNMKQRHEVFLVFKETIANLVKAGGRDVEVHMGLEKSTLLFAIQFDNEGVDLEQIHNLLNRQDIGAKLASIDGEMDIEEHRADSLLLMQVKVS